MTKDWRQYAACQNEDPEMFFPPDYEGPLRRLLVTESKEVCRRCLVRVPCLDRAMEIKGTVGVWGGTTEDERKDLHKNREKVTL